MINKIKQEAEKITEANKIKCVVSVTPSFICFEGIESARMAKILEAAFVANGMKSLGVDNLAELGMGKNWSLTISY